MANANCGKYFFFRSNKGRCFCESVGENCQRVSDSNFDEYVLGNGELMNLKIVSYELKPM